MLLQMRLAGSSGNGATSVQGAIGMGRRWADQCLESKRCEIMAIATKLAKLIRADGTIIGRAYVATSLGPRLLFTACIWCRGARVSSPATFVGPRCGPPVGMANWQNEHGWCGWFASDRVGMLLAKACARVLSCRQCSP